MTRELEHLLYKDRLRAGAFQPGEEKAPRRPESGLPASKGGCKKEGDQILWFLLYTTFVTLQSSFCCFETCLYCYYSNSTT